MQLKIKFWSVSMYYKILVMLLIISFPVTEMAWRSHGKNNAELVRNLRGKYITKGYLKSNLNYS